MTGLGNGDNAGRGHRGGKGGTELGRTEGVAIAPDKGRGSTDAGELRRESSGQSAGVRCSQQRRPTRPAPQEDGWLHSRNASTGRSGSQGRQQATTRGSRECRPWKAPTQAADPVDEEPTVRRCRPARRQVPAAVSGQGERGHNTARSTRPSSSPRRPPIRGRVRRARRRRDPPHGCADRRPCSRTDRSTRSPAGQERRRDDAGRASRTTVPATQPRCYHHESSQPERPHRRRAHGQIPTASQAPTIRMSPTASGLLTRSAWTAKYSSRDVPICRPLHRARRRRQ